MPVGNRAMSDLHQILQWVQEQGELEAIASLRIKLMPHTVEEGICIDDVTSETIVSEEYLGLAMRAATEVVGRPCLG